AAVNHGPNGERFDVDAAIAHWRATVGTPDAIAPDDNDGYATRLVDQIACGYVLADGPWWKADDADTVTHDQDQGGHPMNTKYHRISTEPKVIRWDTPRANQGQMIQVSYGDTRWAPEYGEGDRFMRVIDHSTGETWYYRRSR